MKKLSKIKLRDFHKMNDVEMKKIIGGVNEYDGSLCSASMHCWGSYHVTCNGDECFHRFDVMGRLVAIECSRYGKLTRMTCTEGGYS